MILRKRLAAIFAATALASTALVGCSSTNEGGSSKGGTGNPYEVLSNKNAREAIALAVDKQPICDVILNNGSKAVSYFTGEGLAVNNGKDYIELTKDAGYPHDDVKALEAWNKAKEEVGFDNVELEILTSDSDISLKMSEYLQGEIQSSLEGATVKIKSVPFKQQLQLQQSGDYHISTAGWSPDYPDPLTFLDTMVAGKQYAEQVGYNSEEYNKLIDEAKKESNLDTSWAKYAQAEKLMLDDAYMVPLYQRTTSYLEKPEVSGILRNNWGAEYGFKTADVDRANKELNVSRSADASSLDPSKATDAESSIILSNSMEALTRVDEQGNAVPGMAEKWSTSEDGLTWTFNLRKGAKWSNGTEVTAKDFEYSWKRTLDPKTASEYAWILYDIEGAEDANLKNGSLDKVGVTAIDDYTLEVKLNRPVTYFDKLVVDARFLPVNQAFVESQGDKFGNSVETTIYNGPFTLTTWKIEDQYIMSKNANYWDTSNVKLNKVNVKIVKETNADINLYENGNIDLVKLSSEFVEKYKNDANFKNKATSSVFYMELNGGKGAK
ncbi:MAG: ABC transporter substrate-binding protein [Romboutsia sp.]